MNSLVSYSGSSSDEELDERPKSACVKRKQSQGTEYGSVPPLKRKRGDCQNENHGIQVDDDDHDDDSQHAPEEGLTQNSLPLPGAILGMFEDRQQGGRSTDDPSQHGGRLRSFAHMEGNWASYVYIPVSIDDRWSNLIEELLLCLRPLNFDRMDDLHLSLSRTVCIRHHWIQPLTESLKASFQRQQSCICDVGPLKIYTNDEKTRTFVSLEVRVEDSELMEYVDAVDASFREFNLPVFYRNPSFHVSLVWCVGDVVSHITQETREKMQEVASEFFSTHTDLSGILVKQVLLKTGNKTFAFHLQSVHD